MNNITKKFAETLVSFIGATALALGVAKIRDTNKRKQDMNDTLKRAKTGVKK